MKVFCSGFELDFIHNKVITGRLEEYILSHDEIVVSDMNIMDEVLQRYLADANYDNVSIAFIRDLSEYEEWPRTNMGNWKYRYFTRRQYEYSIDLTIASAMAEECDEGFFTFFEKDIDIFMNILCFLAAGKPCKLYTLNSKTIKTIHNLEEFSKYVKQGCIALKDDVHRVVKEFFEVDELLLHTDYPDEIREKLISYGNKVIHKNDLKKLICKSHISISKKYDLICELEENENLLGELIKVARSLRLAKNVKNKLNLKLMEAYEHSFWCAKNCLLIAETWVDHLDGRNSDLVMYLFERFVSEGGEVTEIPIGMYADIDDALYYLQSSIYDADGGKLEVWEKANDIPKYSHYEHRITVYTNYREVIGFEFMRTADLINDCDPFEPVTYVSKNSHYMSG